LPPSLEVPKTEIVGRLGLYFNIAMVAVAT
jgi:hypothetical protein